MTASRSTVRVAGVLYLVTFLSSIPAWFLLQPVLGHPNYILGGGADTQVTWGAVLDVVTAFAGIGTAVALYSVIKRHHEGLALGFVTTRLMEAAMLLVGVVSTLAIVTLRQDAASGTDDASLVAVGRALVAIHDRTYLFGPGLMPVFNAVLLGSALYLSRLVPRLIPALGLIGAPLLLSATLGTLFGVNDSQSAWTGIATVPIFFWELSIGLWMTFKGFDSAGSDLTVAEHRARVGPPAATEAGAT